MQNNLRLTYKQPGKGIRPKLPWLDAAVNIRTYVCSACGVDGALKLIVLPRREPGRHDYNVDLPLISGVMYRFSHANSRLACCLRGFKDSADVKFRVLIDPL